MRFMIFYLGGIGYTVVAVVGIAFISPRLTDIVGLYVRLNTIK